MSAAAFKTKPFEDRLEEARGVRERFPDRIPIIIEKDKRATELPELDRFKFLFPSHFFVVQLLYVLKERLHLPQTDAFYLFINDQAPTNSQTLQSLYDNNKNEDGFLYMKYSSQAAFGGEEEE
ncbi:putative multi-domain containing protein [Aduncisulcus paluster]|uniref:Autophagy-related protein n=1 Tax=Aduncisulcus paluster TaxID=2918883 RepID=A0ABQ5KV07_9EUKA|nr:putative multi-domain containing protein [Aduncisulcus paluster]|eukprot:gnl/Carplike_NY0171/1097_a1493_1648.p1 GENE.gnl/Carplike_NY0171/1097_a1493_1648~~gnl/Carplike_NY0171/1097_a1493_1648.p1  ORF type:complete len:136 (-),score=30.28 gnl/Carplike_NY0171/1097_a1493_1648:89-457(-)